VLIVDEAQSLPLHLLEEIRLLANIETDDRKLLSVILAGQPELAQRLEDQALRQLKQRVALRCDLRPLTARESAGYIAGRILIAGGNAASVFTQQAVAIIYEHSGGIPRTISVIADNALLGGFAAGERPVASQTVRTICHDFALTSSPHSRNGAAASPAPINGTPADDGNGLLDLKRRLAAYDPEAMAGGGHSGSVLSGSAPPRRKRFAFFWS
jgi:general secretion pathway protein A